MGFDSGDLGLVSMLILWVVIIALALWLLGGLFPRVRGNSSSHDTTRHSDPDESPLEILKQRYARGEISKVEYEEMRRDLDAQLTQEEFHRE